MLVLKSIAIFVLAALAEIRGAWLVWQACGSTRAGFGSVLASSRSASTGSSPPFSPTRTSAGSLAWGMVADGFLPDRWDVTGALICLAG